MRAPEILAQAAQTLADRGKERDTVEGERSMRRAVELFTGLTGWTMPESKGWLFMIALKLARAERSNNPDHYIDLAGYVALLGEHVLSGGPDDDGWIAWHGDSENGPLEVLPHEKVEVKFREDLSTACGAGPKEGWHWRHAGTGDDVCAYRVIREESK
ncbi:phosphofructokinase [Thiohalocapsa phage LS06-2018-MD04]|jgi:hypothetical protein|nr:phosphofructokinase [Thiohalocapsa phage LS06-2018-MD04]